MEVKNIGVNGVIRPAAVDDPLIPDTAVTEVQNFHFDRVGVATVRPGLTNTWGTVVIPTLGDTYNPCLGMFNAQGSWLLAAFRGSSIITYDVFSYNGVGWGRMAFGGGFGLSAKIRFVDFAGRTAIMNGTYDSVTMNIPALSYRGTTPTAPPLNLNQFTDQHLRASMGEAYKSRMYLAGDADKTSRLFFSSVIDSAGNITWNPSIDYVDINPGDGEIITSLKRYSLELLVFKPNYMYRYRTSGLDPDPLIQIGTRSHESVVEGKKGVYFHHDTGFYRYSGGYPIEISRPIIDFIKAIPFTQYDDIAGWKDTDHIYWSVGNLTIPETMGNVIWKNIVLRYTESSDIWTILSYPSDARRGATYVTANNLTTVVAFDNGVVATQNTGTTDLGEPIKFRLVTKWYDDEKIEDRKIIKELLGQSEKMEATEVMYQVDDRTDWQSMGQLQKFLTYFRNQKITYHRVRFKITGVSRAEAPIFRGLKVLDGLNEGLIRT